LKNPLASHAAMIAYDVAWRRNGVAASGRKSFVFRRRRWSGGQGVSFRVPTPGQAERAAGQSPLRSLHQGGGRLYFTARRWLRIPPRVYFEMLQVRCIEILEGQRDIAWPCANSGAQARPGVGSDGGNAGHGSGGRSVSTASPSRARRAAGAGCTGW